MATGLESILQGVSLIDAEEQLRQQLLKHKREQRFGCGNLWKLLLFLAAVVLGVMVYMKFAYKVSGVDRRLEMLFSQVPSEGDPVSIVTIESDIVFDMDDPHTATDEFRPPLPEFHVVVYEPKTIHDGIPSGEK